MSELILSTVCLHSIRTSSSRIYLHVLSFGRFTLSKAVLKLLVPDSIVLPLAIVFTRIPENAVTTVDRPLTAPDMHHSMPETLHRATI